MGLKDEDYRKALEEKQRQLQVEYIKLQMEKQKEEARMSISGATGLGNLIGSMGGAGQQALNSNGINPYQAQQAQQAVNAAGPMGGGNLTYTATTGTWGVGTGVTLNNIAHPIGLKVLTEKDIHHDAMKAPLSALVDMWTMRWQGNWVNEGEFDEDDFWRLALVRLLGASKLEKHNLADQHRSVYRIIE